MGAKRREETRAMMNKAPTNFILLSIEKWIVRE